MNRNKLVSLLTAGLLLLGGCVGGTPAPTASPSPAAPPSPSAVSAETSEAAGAAIAAWLDQALRDASGPAARLEYYGDGASGPSGVLDRWDEENIGELEALFSAHTWGRVEADLTAPAVQVETPEGGACSMRLSGNTHGACQLTRGVPYIQLQTESGSAVYRTEDCDGLYLSVERFAVGQTLAQTRERLWGEIDGALKGRTVTARLSGGGEKKAAWDEISGEVKELVEARSWIFLPLGPQQPAEDAGALTLTGGETDGVRVYGQGGYLYVSGFCYKSLDADGAADSIYPELCALLGIV